MSFSKWLVAQKDDRDNLSKFARKLNIPYSTLYGIIKHGQEPEARTIRLISAGLDLPVEEVWKKLG